MKSFFTTILTLFMGFFAIAQSFEGVISFDKITFRDTMKYRYYVKGKNVRLDEMDMKENVVGTMLINTETEEVLTLSHERKLYMKLTNKKSIKDMSACKVNKTDERKDIMGFSCKKWTVINAVYGTSAEFWVVEDNYNFFIPLLNALKVKDRLSLYFLQIPYAEGAFPIMGIEKDMANNQIKTNLKATEIRPQQLSGSLFEVPEEYTEF